MINSKKADLAEVFKRILALKLYPVGVKFCKRTTELKKGKIPNEKLTFCQMVRLSAQSKWQLSCPRDYMGCYTAQLIFGFRKQDEKDIENSIRLFTDNRKIAKSITLHKPKLKPDEIEGILVGPLGGFEPDLVFLIVDSAQALPLIEAYGVSTGKDLSFRNGTSSEVCSYGAVWAYKNQQPNLTIPCIGAKRLGLFQDYELIFTMPYEWSKKLANALLEFEQTNRLHIPMVNGFLSPTKPIDYLLRKEKKWKYEF